MYDDEEQYDLSELFRALTAAANSHGIFLVDGIPETKVHWSWDGESGKETEFIELAAILNTPVIYVEATTFVMVTNVSKELYEADFASIEEEDLDYPRLLKRLEKSLSEWKVYDGRMASFSMRFPYSGIIHGLDDQTEWLTDFNSDLDQALADLETSLADKIEKAKVKARNDLKEKAGVVARDPRYAKAKNATMRNYLLDEMFPNLEPNDRWKIQDLASAIYADEILPQIERQLVAEVVELRRQGLSAPAIKARLGISKERVDRLIVLADQ